jgi:hypothetical protein
MEMKEFSIHFARLEDPAELAVNILRQVLKGVDHKYGGGGLFTDVGGINRVEIRQGDASRPCVLFSANIKGVVMLTVSAEIWPDWIALSMIFSDFPHWRTRASEETVAHTMFCVDRALASFEKSSTRPNWFMAGSWTYGVLFPCEWAPWQT